MQVDELLAHVDCGTEPPLVDRQIDVVSIDELHHPEIIIFRGLCFIRRKLPRIGSDAAASVDDSFLQLRMVTVKGIKLLALDVFLHGFKRVGHSVRYEACCCRRFHSFEIRFAFLIATVTEHAQGEHERRDSGKYSDCESYRSTDRIPRSDGVDDVDGQYLLSDTAIS